VGQKKGQKTLEGTDGLSWPGSLGGQNDLGVLGRLWNRAKKGGVIGREGIKKMASCRALQNFGADSERGSGCAVNFSKESE